MWRMWSFYVAWAKPFLAQPARDLEVGRNLAQPVREMNDTFVQQVVAEIPWFYNVMLIEKLKNTSERLW
jgi:hypothetical protein